jgi:hypothetical protein
MKLSADIVITRTKLTNYLLVPRRRNDKSKWLAWAGYTLKNWHLLENDLRNLILSADAIPIENTEYGQMYEIRRKLLGPNGKSLSVCTIWMTETATGKTKFITMYPDKEGDR